MELMITSPLVITILAILLLTLLIKRSISHLTSKRISLPPSPPRLPIIGNLHQLGRLPHRSLHSLSLQYGPLMLLHLGRTPVLVASTAETAQEIMKTHDKVFASRPKLALLGKLLCNHRDVAGAPYGEYWRQMKSLCVLNLLSNKMVRSFRYVREEEAKDMMDKIQRASSTSSPVNLSEVFSTLTNNVICRVALGRKYSGVEGGKYFRKLLGKFIGLLGGFNVGEYIPWLAWFDRISGLEAEIEKVAKDFDDFLEGVVQEHLERGGGDARSEQQHADFVDVLLSIQREKAVGFEIDDLSIKAIILDVFAGGTDTTYTVLEWVMTELLRHPKAMKRLQNEIREITDRKSHVSEDDLQEMAYLKAVIKETLRLHPPVPLLVPRECTQDIDLKGYHIAAGTQVYINAYAIGREAATWGDDADEFRPERFLNSPIDFRGHDFGLVPFGAGRRSCPAITFAVAVDELALANVVHRFNWKVAGGGGDLDVTEETGITIHRKFPLIAYAVDAENPSD